jgi:uncharacterized membrane protein YedE/YeeE
LFPDTDRTASRTVVTLIQQAGYAKFPPRKPSSLGLFGRYDGNVIGGVLLGAGMALSGACPGTVLAQVAHGIPSGLWASAGGVAASIAWSSCIKKSGPLSRSSGLRSCQQTSASADSARDSTAEQDFTIYGRLGVARATVLTGFVLMCATVVATTVALSLGPESTAATLLGGVSIGLVQLLSIYSRDSLLGVSAAYEEMGNWLLWPIRRRRGNSKPSHPQQSSSLLFAAGVVAGSWLLAQAAPHLARQTKVLDVSPPAAFLGGAAMIWGASLAGGCTSGHGISGVSLFSISSFVTLVSMFAGGAAVALPMR